MREIRADWEKFGQIRRSPGAGGRCFLAIIRVYFIASAIFLRNCLVPSHAQEWSFGAVPPQERWHEEVLVWGILSQARERSFGAVPSQERRHEEVLVWGIPSPPLERHNGDKRALFCFGRVFM